jgi:ribosomal protein S12 methylthiotransferase accessory factor
MPDLLADRDVLDGLSLAAREHLTGGLCGPDFGVVSTVVPMRMRPGSLESPAVVFSMPHLASLVGLGTLDRPATGFGTSHEALFGSGLGELIERYAAAIVPDALPVIPHDRRVAIGDWTPFDREQLARDDFPYEDPRAHADDIPFVWATDASSGAPVGVPADLVYLRSVSGIPWCTITSNGLAAHRTAGAALRAAFWELVERDAFFRAWYGGRSHTVLHAADLSRGRVDLPATLVAALDAARRAGVEIRIVALPAIGGHWAFLACARSERIGLTIGCAAKADHVSAIASAVVESIQTHNWAMTMPAGVPERIDALEGHVRLHADPRSRHLNGFLDAGPDGDVDRLLTSHPVPLRAAIDRTRTAGWRLYFADVSSSDVRAHGWHVIRALSPQAATLDVDEIHGAQHPIIHNRAPHPFP